MIGGGGDNFSHAEMSKKQQGTISVAFFLAFYLSFSMHGYE
jgi:hypothetical protein